jgi:hypothetical protein
MTAAQNNARAVMARWTALRATGLAALSARLKTAGLAPLSIQ